MHNTTIRQLQMGTVKFSLGVCGNIYIIIITCFCLEITGENMYIYGPEITLKHWPFLSLTHFMTKRLIAIKSPGMLGGLIDD
jgi:hypothetical protein